MIKIYGAGDDLIAVGGCKGANEFSSYADGRLMWRGDLIAPNNGQMRIYGIYDGCWHFSIGQVDEDVPLPSWPVQISQQERSGGRPSRSTLVEIDAPEGTRLTNVWPARYDDE